MNAPTADSRPTRLLFLVTEDWYFWSHRLSIARAARDHGIDVSVAARVRKHGERIANERISLHPLGWRRSAGVIQDLPKILTIRRLYQDNHPDILHHVSLKPVIFGSIAAVLSGQRRVVNAINGLGLTFITNSLKARVQRQLLRLLFPLFIDRANSVIILQNDDDRDYLVSRRFVRHAKIVVVRGSGVDTSHFTMLPPPHNECPTIAVVSRMLRMKGIDQLVAASRLLQTRGVKHRLLLVGDADPDNPSSISTDVLQDYAREPQIEFLGFRDDVREIWSSADIAALTSLGGEGVPKSLIEAAACGRPIVATNVPGCRDIAIDGTNGLLVPVNDPEAIANALQRLIEDKALRLRFGSAGRKRVEAHFSDDVIVSQILAIYRELLARPPR